MWSDRSWKDAAISTEGIKWSSVNNLCHLMNESRFIKKSRRKSQHLCVGYVFKWMKTLLSTVFFVDYNEFFVEVQLKKNLKSVFWEPEFNLPFFYSISQSSFFLIGIYSMQYEARSLKRLKRTGNPFRKKLRLKVVC